MNHKERAVILTRGWACLDWTEENMVATIAEALATVERETWRAAANVVRNQQGVSHWTEDDTINLMNKKATIQDEKFTEKGRLLNAQETESSNQGAEASGEAANSSQGAGPDRSVAGDSREHGGLEKLHEERRLEVQGDGANHSVNALTSKDYNDGLEVAAKFCEERRWTTKEVGEAMAEHIRQFKTSPTERGEVTQTDSDLAKQLHTERVFSDGYKARIDGLLKENAELKKQAPAVTQEEEHDPWVYLPCGRHNDHSPGCSDCQRVRQSEYILKRQREVAKAICNRPDVTRPVTKGEENA